MPDENNTNAQQEQPKTVKWTLRLTPEQDDLIADLAATRGTSKNKAIQYLIDHIDILGQREQQISQLLEDVQAIKEAHGLDGPEEPAVIPAQANDATTESLETNTDMGGKGSSDAILQGPDGRAIVLSELDPFTRERINPFQGPYHTHVKQSVAQREGVIAACLNFLRDNDNRSIPMEQLRNLINKIFPDYGTQAVDQRIQGLIDKQVIYPEPIRDPRFTKQLDSIVRTAFEDDYDSMKKRRKVPATVDDAFPLVLRNLSGHQNSVYLDAKLYLMELNATLEGFADACSAYYEQELKTVDVERRRTLYLNGTTRFALFVQDRIFEICGPGHGFNADEFKDGVYTVVLQDTPAREVPKLAKYFDEDDNFNVIGDVEPMLGDRGGSVAQLES